jgi:DNA-binding MarR family transcriptional regulator
LISLLRIICYNIQQRYLLHGVGLPMESNASTDDIVFQLAVELINQTNRPLKISELYAMASKMGLTPSQTNNSIYNLLKTRKIVEGSKLTKENIMTNPLRAQIVEHVTQNPGCHVRDIRRAMNIDNAESAWHLKMLEKFGFLRSKRFGKFLAYYPAALPESDYDEILCTIRQDTTYRVLYDLYTTPQSSLNDISQRLAMNPSTIQYHVEKLLKLSVISAAPDPATNDNRYLVNNDVWNGILQIAPGFAG